MQENRIVSVESEQHVPSFPSQTIGKNVADRDQGVKVAGEKL